LNASGENRGELSGSLGLRFEDRLPHSLNAQEPATRLIPETAHSANILIDVCSQMKSFRHIVGHQVRTFRVRGRRVSAGRFAFAMFLLLSFYEIVSAEPQRKPTEYELKAAYLYNFGKFVRWPANVAAVSGEPFLICVLGQDPFGSSLDATVNGESIDGKRLSVRHLTNLVDAGKCRVLFVSTSEERHLDSVLLELSKRPVLTVSDIPDFVDRGGAIGFVNQGEKIRFQVNLGATDKAGLILSSDLLKVAVSVKRDSHSGE
jgi:hypothetical protein